MGQESKYYFEIDYKSPIPVYEQIKRSLILLITSGETAAGERVPPIRELASILKVNHNTVVKVYYQLEQEQYLYSKPGTGYFVLPGKGPGKDEDRKILCQITEEYLHQALKLGFSLEDVLAEIDGFKRERLK